MDGDHEFRRLDGDIREMAKGAGLIYRSFIDAARMLDDKSQLEAMNAYFDYLLDGVQYAGENPVVKALMLMAIPVIDGAQARYEAKCENGKKGGRPKTKKNLTETEKNLKKPKVNQNESETNLIDEDVDEEEDEEHDDDVKEEQEEEIKPVPVDARPLSHSHTHEIRKKVVEDADLSTLADETWITPTEFKAVGKDVYVLGRNKQVITHIRDRYGGFFENSIRAVLPEAEKILYAVG